MDSPIPTKSATPVTYSLEIKQPLIKRWKRRMLGPFRKMGRALLGWIVDKARYEIVYLTFHGYDLATCAYVAAKLGVFDHLNDGPKSADELAKLTQSDPSNLYRMLRGLAALRYLHQSDDGQFSLSAFGELLCEDHPRSLRHWAIQWGQDVLPVLPEFENQVQQGASNAFIRTHGKS
ncbi:MAG: hypothetical protein KDA84_21880, partial [Planctomycetaceae bacterium]|nr:hypothetical protein [Planctomycetaceae bacterium]